MRQPWMVTASRNQSVVGAVVLLLCAFKFWQRRSVLSYHQLHDQLFKPGSIHLHLFRQCLDTSSLSTSLMPGCDSAVPITCRRALFCRDAVETEGSVFAATLKGDHMVYALLRALEDVCSLHHFLCLCSVPVKQRMTMPL